MLYHIEILSITRMITERIGLHSVLLPLLIVPIESKTAPFLCELNMLQKFLI